jgi:hypothetical protein
VEITFTSSPGFQKGDIVLIPISLSRWQRFLIWCANPFRWPPRTRDGYYVVTAVAGNSAEIER